MQDATSEFLETTVSFACLRGSFRKIRPQILLRKFEKKIEKQEVGLLSEYEFL